MPPPQRINDGDYHYHTYDYVGAVAWTPSAQPARNNWHFYSLVADLQALLGYGGELGVPNIALTNVGAPTATGGRRTKQLSFGSNDATAPTVVITGGIHAREWIAAEFVYLLAEYLVMHYTAQPQNGYQQAIHDLVNTRRIRIIPMLNPDGNDVSVYGLDEGDRNQRKNTRVLPDTGAELMQSVMTNGVTNPPFRNARPWVLPTTAQYDVPDYDPDNGIPPAAGNYSSCFLDGGATGVDLNRNLDTPAWGYVCEPDGNYPMSNPRSDDYFGPNRNSEIETRNLLLALTGAANPDIASAVDYHSYGKCILYPCEQAHNDALGYDFTGLGRSLHELIRAQGATGPDYQLGTPLDLVGYDGTGSVPDHEARVFHTRAFTIELDPADTGQGLAGFNLEETAIRGVFEKNIRAALALIAAPGTPGNRVMALLQLVAMAWSEYQFFGWNVYDRGNQLPQ